MYWSMTLAELFADGPILITLLGGSGRRVKMGIEAPTFNPAQRLRLELHAKLTALPIFQKLEARSSDQTIVLSRRRWI